MSCNKFESKETPLTTDLVSFTALDETKQDTLIGVKDCKTGTVIIAPQKLDSIQADAYVILTKTAKKLKAYRFNGKQIGQTEFSTFEQVYPYNEKTPICIGHAQDYAVFYFPTTKEEVCGTKYYLGLKHIFIQETLEDGHCWSFRKTTGKQTWRLLVEENFYLIKDISSKKETFYIGVLQKNNSVILYDINGKELKNISASRWKRAQRLMQHNTQIGRATYIECKNVDKI